uniref:NTF2 domain-containing protein n=1 Tax=Nelumbo nucifera TaxID=4432 RepID=A0A822YUJ7_NELNU|nr:TPA_asm: hypothetical protein HUJ06_006993 [Nelumbo nucifera]
MASQQPAGSCPTAQVVGNAFVHQYYHIMHQSPELVYRFYQDISKFGRLEADGSMSAVTTMQAINEKILSLDYSKYRSEIKDSGCAGFVQRWSSCPCDWVFDWEGQCKEEFYSVVLPCSPGQRLLCF